MSWFNEQDNQDIPTESRSHVVAMSNLLQQHNYALTPPIVHKLLLADDPTIDSWSIARAFQEIEVGEVMEGDSWPDTNNAIIRQRRIDEKQAGVVDHYSLVADQRAHSIIDSYDGRIKNAAEYGPVLSWVSYTYTEPEVAPAAPEPAIEVAVDPNLHILQEGENLWDVGRHYNIPVAVLMAENEIEDPRHIPIGTELYIPDRPKRLQKKNIEYELFLPARKMHIARSGGAKKWSFGGIQKWEDLFSTGRLYPDGTNVDIVAVANVPIGEDTAAYYLDALSLGDYASTGMVRYTSGFNWKHLAEGHTAHGTPPVKEITVEQVVADAMAEEDRPEMKPIGILIEEAEVLPVAPLSYKNTFTFLNDTKKSEYYTFKKRGTIVKEMDGRLPDKILSPADTMRVIGTFEHEGITYARAAVPKYWYAARLDDVIPEDSLYNTDIDLPSRLAIRGHLSRAEKRMVMLSKAVAKYTKLTTQLQKHKQRSQ